MSEVVAVIPARYGSRRLPAKPLADIRGKPMVQRAYEQAGKATLVDRVIVATDDERVAEAVKRFGGEPVMTPTEISSGTDRVAYVARSFGDETIVVNVQGDEPFIPPSMIDDGIRPMISDESIHMATVVGPITSLDDLRSPSVVKCVVSTAGKALYFSRSPIPYGRDVPEDALLKLVPFYKHYGLYVYRRSFLLKIAALPATRLELAEKLEQLRVLEHGYDIHVSITDGDSLSVDTPEDLDRARRQAERTS